jgi:acetyl esterase/lipase
MHIKVTSIAALLVLVLTASASAEPKVTVEKDLIYGRVSGAALAADVAWSESQELMPAIISVHGGRWVGGHKRDTSAIQVEQWAGFGFFAMSIDYRLRDCTPAPACYQDLQCAIRFVHANAEKYRVDSKRVFLIGQSAGGHLVSLAATIGDGPYPRTGGWEKAKNDIAAAISVAACYDLPSLDWGKQWGPPGVDSPSALEQASPNRHLSKDARPLLILHSDDDRSVPIANALIMVEALKKAGARHTFHHYTDLGHMQITQEVIDKSLAFIKEVSTTAGK